MLAISRYREQARSCIHRFQHVCVPVLALVAGALPAPALSATTPCAVARDPVRCEAREAALKACAATRGADKQGCIQANMPPVDCRQTRYPSRCEAEQNAWEICRGKAGTELRKCLREWLPQNTVTKRPAAA